jgi:hypothetical protein
MPEFRENEKHKVSHKQIHDGLDRVNLLVVQWKEDPSTYKPDELRAALDSFREPLYRHLAEEVYVDQPIECVSLRLKVSSLSQ